MHHTMIVLAILTIGTALASPPIAGSCQLGPQPLPLPGIPGVLAPETGSPVPCAVASCGCLLPEMSGAASIQDVVRPAPAARAAQHRGEDGA
jgi:hypothetical protein